MRLVFALFAALLALPVFAAQSTAKLTAGAIPTDSFELAQEASSEGSTILKVVSPEGALVRVWEGKKLVHEDDAPTSFRPQPDVFYRVQVKVQDGRLWEKKLAFRARHDSTLSVIVPAPAVAPVAELAPPAPMGSSDFEALLKAIRSEPFEPRKLAIVREAVETGYFDTRQLGALVDLFSFSDGKIATVELVRPRLLDPQNAKALLGHFDFESDRAKIKAMFPGPSREAKK